VNPDVHRAALLAAARIACAGSLVACHKVPAPVAAAPVATEAAESELPPPLIAESDGARTLPTRDEVATCEALTDEAFAEFRALSESATGEVDEAFFDKLDATRDAAFTDEVMACCHSLALHHSFPRGLDGPSDVGMYDTDCCTAVDFDYPACTPWGPPAPPSMPALA
jgi:hypothetical protein